MYLECIHILFRAVDWPVKLLLTARQGTLKFMPLLITTVTVVSCGNLKKTTVESPKQNGVLGLNGKTVCQVHAYTPTPFLSLTDDGEGLASALPQGIQDELASRLPTGITARLAASVGSDRSGSNSADQSLHLPIEFMWGNYPLCPSQYYAKAHIDTGATRIKGKLPSDVTSLISTGPMPAFDSEKTKMILKQGADAAVLNDGQDLELGASQQCWYAEGNRLKPSLEVDFAMKNSHYHGLIVGDKVIESYSLSLHATASIYTYRQNADSPIEEFIVEGMQPNGFLCNDYFIADVEGVQEAQSTQGVFRYETSDSKFLESTIFAHANEMMKWFLSFDKAAHWSKTQVELRLTTDTEVRRRGPRYENPQIVAKGSNLGGPVILISDHMINTKGDVVLDNLRTDFDVVAHELGHHIVTRFLPVGSAKDLDQLMVHEGLADFFVFAKTGDACLAESVCKASAPEMCSVANRCLRAADIGYVYDKNKPDGPHRRGQALSGMLWDLSQRSEIGTSTVVKLVMTSLKYLDRQTNLDDVYQELINADKTLNQGKNRCAIRDAAADHGFPAAVSSPGC